jgi:hypothetical protein
MIFVQTTHTAYIHLLPALLKDGFRLARLASHVFAFVSSRFVPLPEAVKTRMDPHVLALEAGHEIYIERDAKRPGTKAETVSVEQYRQVAAGFTPWSTTRFDALISLVKREGGMRLVVFVEPCHLEKLHLLCVMKGESNLVAAMALIE